MNKIIILATALSLLSCSKEIGSKGKEDCDCDRVYGVKYKYNKLIYAGDNSYTTVNLYTIQTVNDCSKFNQTKEFLEYSGTKIPEVGTCF
jgi:hypothetical protein